MATRKRPTKAQMQRAVDDWNAKHTEKTQVRYWPGVREGEGKVGWTQTEATILGGHTAGVYIGGAGFVALSHVEPVVEEVAMFPAGMTPELGVTLRAGKAGDQ